MESLDNLMDHATLQAVSRGPHTTEDRVRSQADCVYSDRVTLKQPQIQGILPHKFAYAPYCYRPL